MNKVHFVLDEAASLGHMDALDDAVDKYRGYGVRCQFYYQSVGQLKKCWPDGQDQTLLSNCSTVWFGVNDNESAKYVSDRLGDETVVVDSGGGSSGKSVQGPSGAGSGSTSYSESQNSGWQQQARKLLKPEEVIALSPRVAITFTPGVPPLWTTLLRYYEESFGPASAIERRRSLAGIKSGCVAVLMAAILISVCVVKITEEYSAYRALPQSPARRMTVPEYRRPHREVFRYTNTNSDQSENPSEDGLSMPSGATTPQFQPRLREEAFR